MSRTLVLATLLTLALVALQPGAASAADFRSANTITIPAGQTIDDDLYITAGTIDVQGKVNGDLIVAGGNVTVAGPVSGSVMAAGGTVTISAPVGGSVRAAGGTLTIQAPVGADVVVAGGSTMLKSSAKVGRDVVVGAGTTVIDGEVGRNVQARSGDLTLAAPVHGSVTAQGGQLHLLDAARVDGNLTYTSNNTAQIDPGAVVKGKVTRHNPQQSGPYGRITGIIGWLRTLVGLTLLGLLFLLLFPRFARRSTSTLGSAPLPSVGTGCGFFFLGPVLIAILLFIGIFIGGWWISLIALALYIVAAVLGLIISGLTVGTLIFRAAGWRDVWVIFSLVLGLAMLFGLGALTLSFIRARREPPAATPVVAPPPVVE